MQRDTLASIQREILGNILKRYEELKELGYPIPGILDKLQREFGERIEWNTYYGKGGVDDDTYEIRKLKGMDDGD